MNKLTGKMIETIKSAASQLTGFKRRAFMAEVALEHCDGSVRKAETWFGWGRETARTGLNEKRTGIRCIDNFSARGRKKTEEKSPQLIEEIEQIVEPQSQADPKFQTTFAFTRITARAVRDALLKQDQFKTIVPSRQTVGVILNRLGYRLRRVVKTRPEKKSPKPTTSLRTSTRVANPLVKKSPV